MTRLLILGLIRLTQPVHGYEVRRELLSWNADRWANVAPGSIYHALKKLTEEGLLRAVSTEQVGSRPARTRYELTEWGEQEFQGLLREYWWEEKPATDPFMAAFSFQPVLSQRETVAALRNRAACLRGVAAGLEAGIASGFVDDYKPPHVIWMFKRWIAMSRAEADWCDEVAGEVDSGALASEEWAAPTVPLSSNNQT